MARKKGVHVGRSFFLGGEESIAEFLLKIAVQIEFGSARVDHDFGGVVVEKEWDVHALGGDLHPLARFSFMTLYRNDDGDGVKSAIDVRSDWRRWQLHV